MSPHLAVTFLVDASCVAEHVRQLVAWVQGQAQMRCNVVVLPCTASVNYLGRPALADEAHPPSPLARACRLVLWSALLFVERLRMRATQFKGQSDRLLGLQALDFPGGVTVFDTLLDEPPQKYIQRVRKALLALSPDVIVQCGSFKQAHEFAECAPHGLLEIVYGNNPKFRGGPPGFWEVFYRADKTGFLIHQWAKQSSAELDSTATATKTRTPAGATPLRSKVLMEGFLPTQGFFSLNRATLVLQASRHLQQVLLKLASGSPLALPKPKRPFDGVLRPCPTSLNLAAYMASVALRVVKSRLQTAVGAQAQWGVHYACTDWKSLVLQRSKRIPNPSGGYYADPFIHDTDQGRYCFVEEFRHSKNKGEIAVLRMDGTQPLRIGTVLEEPFHLSFPFLFEFENVLYMCPESHGSGQIRIYRCNDFPLHWQLHSVAMEAVAAVDTMIFPAHGVWWLMSSIHPLGDTETYPELHIFSAPDPLSGRWVPHEQNPVVVDPEFARNAGLLRDGGKLYRVSQARSFSTYGAWATVSEVKTLSLTTYEENLVSQLKPGFDSRASGLHHLQSCKDFTVWDQKHLERAR